MKKQLKSFGSAFSGIISAVKTEAHLRFHFSAAVLVLVFAGICGFSKERFAVLLVLIALVISLELVNTAVEHACNAVTREYDRNIKLAKDMAAGAVLAASVFAAAVGAVLFLNADSFTAAVRFFSLYPWAAVPLCAFAAAEALFVIFFGRNKSK